MFLLTQCVVCANEIVSAFLPLVSVNEHAAVLHCIPPFLSHQLDAAPATGKPGIILML